MTLRVSTLQSFDNLLFGIRGQQLIQSNATAQISSGLRFERPSEDGQAFKKSIDIRHVQAGITASLKGVQTAKSRLGLSQDILAQMLPLLQRASVLAVQQGTETLGSTERQAANVEVTNLEKQLLSLANTKFSDDSLFAGTATKTDAFSSAFSAGIGQHTQGANTSIVVTQTSNANAVNDTYTITLNAAGTQITSVTDAASVEQLAAAVTLSPGANALNLTNGAVLSANFTAPAQMSTAGGTFKVTGANVAGDIQYIGNAKDRSVAITSTQTIVSNARGDHTAFTQIFSAMKNFKAALSANNTSNIQTSITELKTASDAMTELDAEVGGRFRTITLRDQVFQDLKLQTEQRRGQNEDADIATVAAKLAKSQLSLQAAFSVVSKLSQLSLVNFLR